MLRGLNRTDRQNTWSHCRDNLISLARLNRFYSFKHHFNICQNCQIFPVSMSYHSLVQCTFHIQNIKLHSAYWNFNTNLLNDIFFFFYKLLFFYGVPIKRISLAILQYSGGGILVKVLTVLSAVYSLCHQVYHKVSSRPTDSEL